MENGENVGLVYKRGKAGDYTVVASASCKRGKACTMESAGKQQLSSAG